MEEEVINHIKNRVNNLFFTGTELYTFSCISSEDILWDGVSFPVNNCGNI